MGSFVAGLSDDGRALIPAWRSTCSSLKRCVEDDDLELGDIGRVIASCLGVLLSRTPDSVFLAGARERANRLVALLLAKFIVYSATEMPDVLTRACGCAWDAAQRIYTNDEGAYEALVKRELATAFFDLAVKRIQDKAQAVQLMVRVSTAVPMSERSHWESLLWRRAKAAGIAY